MVKVTNDCISRAEIVAAIVNTPTENQHKDVLSALAFRQIEILNIIERAPSVKPEVPHGRWKHKRGDYFTGGGNPVWCCSECGEIIGASMMPPKINFCPRCGARMDGDGNG